MNFIILGFWMWLIAFIGFASIILMGKTIKTIMDKKGNLYERILFPIIYFSLSILGVIGISLIIAFLFGN